MNDEPITGLFACRICGADSHYEVCNRCVPPIIRGRRRMKELGIDATRPDLYYEHRDSKRPLPQRDPVDLSSLDQG